MIRQLNDTLSCWNNKYYVYYQGDEILLTSANDADAITEAQYILNEINKFSQLKI